MVSQGSGFLLDRSSCSTVLVEASCASGELSRQCAIRNWCFFHPFRFFLELVLFFLGGRLICLWFATGFSVLRSVGGAFRNFLFGVIARVVEYDARTRWRMSTSAHCPKCAALAGEDSPPSQGRRRIWRETSLRS